MLNKIYTQIFIGLLWVGFTHGAFASTNQISGVSCEDYKKSWVRTEHSMILNGATVPYTAIAGYLQISLSEVLNGENANNPYNTADETKACIFFTYYHLNNTKGAVQRPLTFAFNGGPGSSSEWLHMGLVSPKRVDMGADGLSPNLPFQLVDNESSPLDISDFVMIDPMATGFSHAEPGSKESPYFNAKNDANSIAVFIRNFLDTFERRGSPIFVMGESYGGLRGPLVAKYLAETFSIPLRGLILISPLFSWATISPKLDDDNDLPYFLALPTMAVVAAYHGQSRRYASSADHEAIYRDARKFAFDKYREALAQGNDLDSKEFHTIAQELSDITGISQQRIEELNLRLTTGDFRVELLKNSYKVLGWYDSRFLGPRLTNQDNSNAPDPENFYTSAFTAAVNQYLRIDLNFNLTTPYVGISYRANNAWTYDSDAQNFNVIHTLSEALVDIPTLKVMVAGGYYDLVVPSATLDLDLARLNPAIDRHRIKIFHYPGGHMLYTNPEALHKLKADLTNYYWRTISINSY